MSAIVEKCRRFLREEDGPTAVEYAVMLALIVIVCAAAITALGGVTNNLFGSTRDTMSGGT